MYNIYPLGMNEMEKLYYRIRQRAFGGWEGMIRKLPLSHTIGLHQKIFFLFDDIYLNEKATKHLRIMGWGHPDLYL